MRDKRFVSGVVATLAGACAWGFSGASIQLLFSRYQIDPLLMTAMRMLGAGAIFLVVLLVRRREQLKAMLSDGATCKRLLVFGVFGLFACSALYTATVFHTNAGTATVMQTLNVVFLLVWTCVRERRLPTLPEFAALACALVATVLIATKGDLTTLALTPWGLALGLATAVAASIYIAYPNGSSGLFARWGSFAVTGVGMVIGGVTALVFWLATGGAQTGLPQMDAAGVALLLVNIVVGTFGAYGLFLHGVSIIGNVRGSMLGAAEPVSATLFSAFWLGTAFSWADWAGLALMVATIALIALSSSSS